MKLFIWRVNPYTFLAVADDEAAARRLIRAEVETQANGRHAIDVTAAMTEPPDVIHDLPCAVIDA